MSGPADPHPAPGSQMLSLGRAVVLLVVGAVVTGVALIAAVGACVAGSHDAPQPVTVTVWGLDILV